MKYSIDLWGIEPVLFGIEEQHRTELTVTRSNSDNVNCNGGLTAATFDCFMFNHRVDKIAQNASSTN